MREVWRKLLGGSDVDADLQREFGDVGQARTAGVAWARNVIQHSGIDVRDAPVAAVRELRRARPGLSLLAAKTLVDELNA